MNWDLIVPAVVSLVVGLFGGGALWAYVRDRKKASAEGQVAIATVEIQVEAARLQSLEKRFAAAEKAWDEERESLLRRLTNAEAREIHLEDRLAVRDQEIEELQSKVKKLRGELDAVACTLNRMKEKP